MWLRRAYETPTRDDGYRILVDRLWPRGVTKDELKLDEWCRDIAPSDDLRRWFGHDRSRWIEFRVRYRNEIDDRQDKLESIAMRAKGSGVTLVYGARDEEHNNAVVLREVIKEMLSHDDRTDRS